jgi:HEAT repeat protein
LELNLMNRFLLAGLTCASLLVALPETGHAHGGQYRGPGDVVPPNPGGGRGTGGPSGPTTGGPAGPATPGPAGPSTPGPAGPSTGGPAGPAPKAPTTGPRGVQLEDDLTRWEFWWEFNKDPYIRLKDAIHTGGVQTGSTEFFLGATRRVEARDTLKPSEEDILGNILPALKKVLDSTDQRDITSSCMVAMAKAGKDHPEFKLLKDVFLPRLSRNDQEVRETAALAIGIAAIAEEDNVNALIALATDSEAGRKLCARSDVDDRTRSFATYGMGLVAHATSNVDVKAKLFAAMSEIVNDDRLTSNRNLKVAALNAIGLLNIDGQSEKEKTLLTDALKVLEDFWLKELGPGEQLIQSHCPPAIAKLVGRDHEKSTYFKDMFVRDMEGKSKVKRSNDHIFQSCALALGQMVRPCEDDKAEDAKYCKALLEQYHKAKDKQTKYFSILALGQIGGLMNRDTLIREFDNGKSLERPWIAVAMGVYAFHKYQAARDRGQTPEPERPFGETLRASLDEKNPSTLAGVAIGLGLCQFKDAADALRALLIKNASQDELAGYLCIALALMNDDRSTEDIRSIVQKAVRRPDLLKQASIALGKLGDKTVADELQKLLNDGDQNLAKLSAVASALGFIGDRRTIEPLKAMMLDSQLTPISRAFAAVALGGVADKESLPWNSKIGTNMNYRAAVETLTDKTAGILDLL